jgi:hypothetical protein
MDVLFHLVRRAQVNKLRNWGMSPSHDKYTRRNCRIQLRHLWVGDRYWLALLNLLQNQFFATDWHGFPLIIKNLCKSVKSVAEKFTAFAHASNQSRFV